MHLYFNNLNSVANVNKKKELNENANAIATTNTIKITQIKKLLSEQSNFSLSIYSVIFCKNQTDLYNIIINAVVESYNNIIGIPHIICSTMEHPDIILILNKLAQASQVSVSYVAADIYGGVLLQDIKPLVTNNTAVIIISYINRLTGTVNNIKEINKFAIEKKIPLFSDCIYAYGKIIIGTPDIFSIDFNKNNLCLLLIKKTIISGYKLNYHCKAIQDGAEKLIKINDADYNKVTQLLVSQKFQITYLKSNSDQLLTLRKYLINSFIASASAKKGRVYYYNTVIKSQVVPNENDIVVLGYDINRLSKITPAIISFIFMHALGANIQTKLKKNNVYVLQESTFENIGLLTKYSKRVITLNLENTTVTDIDLLIYLIYK